MQTMPESIPSLKIEALNAGLHEMLESIRSAVETQQAVHLVEKSLWECLLRMGHDAMTLFFTLSGDGDEGETVLMADGQKLKRLEQSHPRPYLSIFGEFQLTRRVYGSGEKRKIEYAPLDRRLQLPQEKFSYQLQEWDQTAILEMPYQQVSGLLERMLGLRQSVNSLERSNRGCAEAVEGFWRDQPTPSPEEEGELLVCTADGKGVPMRQSKSAVEAKTKGKGPHPGEKKMGLIGAVYSVDPYYRTPEEITDALFHLEEACAGIEEKRPSPCHKHVRAALKRDPADTTQPQVREIFSWMATEVEQRGQGGKKPLILLMDGQESQWNAGREYLPEGEYEVIEILDLIHAVSYVWKGVNLLYPNEGERAVEYAREQVLRLASGQSQSMIQSFRSRATRERLTKNQKEPLEKIIGYFRNNEERIRYNDYLTFGYPVASGVIEGACRTVIKDRMERAGMRWVYGGAHAMMGLRSIHLSGLWDEYLAYRVNTELLRLYPGRAANDDVMEITLCA
ncbi:MAG: ISKra4 family transposase [Gammaproteobacteria bacterium]|nr:ISKra4 family transposase [Gammaproteobacteria bacterium]MBU1654128.1 ISKra4 family transposase [Gammaproteobacteria bacterium]MBU1960144.1 ISKra4 family transposase [Gammaproteobacteria bacterium]